MTGKHIYFAWRKLFLSENKVGENKSVLDLSKKKAWINK